MKSKSPTTINDLLPNVHPGEVLRHDFLEPLGISAYSLAMATGLPQSRLSAILKARRRVTADTALRLARYFGTSARFWLGLQDGYDLEEESRGIASTLEGIRPYALADAAFTPV